MQHNKRIYIFLFVALIALLAVGPILAKGDGKPDSPGKPDTQANSSETHTQGNGNGNGNGSGNGNGNVNPDQPASNGGGDQTSNQDSPTTSTTDSSTTVVTSSDSLLGCQKNNPNRLDCSSLEVTAVCDGDVAVFTITNTGAPGDGDMRAPTQYRLIVDGVVVETGSVQLAGGTSMQITYSGGGTVKLEADQQIGHPGNSLPQSTVTCSVPTATETPVPTDEPTPTDEPYSLAADTLCPSDGSTLFIISNNGGDMTEPVYYVVTDMNGAVVDDGWVQLMAGESFSLQEWATGMLTLDVAGGMVVVNNQCVMVTDEPTPTDEPFVLAADTLCPGDGSTLFIISNNGGDMTEPVYYVVTDMNGAVVDDGWVQLMTGESFSLQEWATGMLTLDVAGGMVVVNNQCVMVTDEPTPTDEPYSLVVDTLCPGDGSTLFIISNNGGDMTEPVHYVVADMNGAVVDDGWVQLMAGESFSLQELATGMLTLDVAGGMVVVNNQCVMVTDEPTPTDEPYSLAADTLCPGDGSTLFIISNNGGDMTEPVYYVVTDMNGAVVDDGWVQLMAGESFSLQEWGAGMLTLDVAGGMVVVNNQCVMVTDEPTPTEEVTPPPEETPTPVPTEPPTLACQKNNPDRLDCSSLQVTAVCEGDTAVFTISNTGEAGNGDMRVPTEYRILVDGTVVESGSVQLTGGETTQIIYSGGGTVTLEADQQIGHPGNSLPQATVSCST